MSESPDAKNPDPQKPNPEKPKRTPKLINIGVRVTPEQRALLEDLETLTGIPQSDQLRIAVSRYLAEFVGFSDFAARARNLAIVQRATQANLLAALPEADPESSDSLGAEDADKEPG